MPRVGPSASLRRVSCRIAGLFGCPVGTRYTHSTITSQNTGDR
ncbi:hypothetical protein ACFOLD_06650 [Kocuria carniphila]